MPHDSHYEDQYLDLMRRIWEAGDERIDRTGVTYSPLSDRWQRSKDLDVNYMVLAARPK